MARKKLGCLGWSIVLVLTVVFAFVGGHLLFAGLEVLALAFTRMGVLDPELAWGLTGLVLGALIGLIVGLRRAGRTHQLLEMALAVAVVGGLAFLGVSTLGGYGSVQAESLPSSVLFDVVITRTDDLNVRPAPSLGNTPVTTVSRGERLGVVDTVPGWYAVRFDRDDRSYQGWISSAYTARLDTLTRDAELFALPPEMDR